MIYQEHFSISPIDGRYYSKTKELRNYFSDFAFARYRVMIEVEYFIELTKAIPQLYNFPNDFSEQIRDFYRKFSMTDLISIKKTEEKIKHDVKSIEYFLRDKFDELNLDPYYKEFIHFGLTSQDINNTAFPSMIKSATNEIYIPLIYELRQFIYDLSVQWSSIPMLSRTHGQAASPTRLGKELMVFVERLDFQILTLKNIPHMGKFGGAVGNFNAHFVAFPRINWINFSNKFLERIGLSRQQFTTQIEHYDGMSSIFNCFTRINTILIDFCRDIWQYISLDYLRNVARKEEVGSSAMPHKVNPIDFENAEGNLGVANALFTHFSQKLPISRLQRDLTDSTVLRSVGVSFAHSILSFKNIIIGLTKITPNEKILELDLEKNNIVITEAVQTILRREGVPDSYNKLKDFTRGKVINRDMVLDFVNSLKIPERIKEEISKITPHNYTGI